MEVRSCRDAPVQVILCRRAKNLSFYVAPTGVRNRRGEGLGFGQWEDRGL